MRMFGFCGDVARITRLLSTSSDFTSAEASFTVMPGSNCWTSRCS
jgi:hypothetical protein